METESQVGYGTPLSFYLCFFFLCNVLRNPSYWFCLKEQGRILLWIYFALSLSPSFPLLCGEGVVGFLVSDREGFELASVPSLAWSVGALVPFSLAYVVWGNLDRRAFLLCFQWDGGQAPSVAFLRRLSLVFTVVLPCLSLVLLIWSSFSSFRSAEPAVHLLPKEAAQGLIGCFYSFLGLYFNTLNSDFYLFGHWIYVWIVVLLHNSWVES